MPRLSELAPQPGTEGVGCGVPGEKLKCPDCGGDLVGVKSGEFRGAAVRTCLVCFGRWVDGAELEKLGGKGFFSRILGALIPRGRAPMADEDLPTAEAPPAEESARTETPEEEDRG